MNPKPRKEKKEVEIKCLTWEKDSHGLFDYESKSVLREAYRVDSSCQIVRQEDRKIKIMSPNEKIEDVNSRILAGIHHKETSSSSFFINPIQSVGSDENTSEGSTPDTSSKSKSDQSASDAYLIVRTLKSQEQQKGYPMEVGDMIKLGRVEYCVIEKRTEEKGVEQTNDIFCEQDQYNFHIDYSKTETKTCRICLCEEEQSQENPLLNPCNCKGSCEYMHFECLKHWVESKVHKKETPLINSFKWKNLECEVCKQPLPKVININNKKMSLIEVPRPEGNYLILEGISREKKVSKGLYIIHNLFTDEDSAKLGRGHTCDIRVQDISVSRCHSYIKYESGQFLLFDNNSKFGTLVRLDKNYPILSDKVGIQVGRTVITFALKPPLQNNNLNTQEGEAQLAQSSKLQQSQLIQQITTSTNPSSLKTKQPTEGQQQLTYSVNSQFKSAPSNNNLTGTNFYQSNPSVRVGTGSNVASTSSNSGNNSITSNKNSALISQSQQQQQNPVDKSQKIPTNNPSNIINNASNKSHKGSTFASTAANNIIGANSGQQVQNRVPSLANNNNFNSTRYKFNENVAQGSRNTNYQDFPNFNSAYSSGYPHASIQNYQNNNYQSQQNSSISGNNNNINNNNNNNNNSGSKNSSNYNSQAQNGFPSYVGSNPSSLISRNSRNIL